MFLQITVIVEIRVVQNIHDMVGDSHVKTLAFVGVHLRHFIELGVFWKFVGTFFIGLDDFSVYSVMFFIVMMMNFEITCIFCVSTSYFFVDIGFDHLCLSHKVLSRLYLFKMMILGKCSEQYGYFDEIVWVIAQYILFDVFIITIHHFNG